MTICWINSLKSGNFTLIFSKSADAAFLLAHPSSLKSFDWFPKIQTKFPGLLPSIWNHWLPSIFYLSPKALEEALGLSYKALLKSALHFGGLCTKGWGSCHVIWTVELLAKATRPYKEAYSLSDLCYWAKHRYVWKSFSSC